MLVLCCLFVYLVQNLTALSPEYADCPMNRLSVSNEQKGYLRPNDSSTSLQGK